MALFYHDACMCLQCHDQRLKSRCLKLGTYAIGVLDFEAIHRECGGITVKLTPLLID